MKKLNKKLRSQRGASITFALLLFLVCAVIGSAVLVAGTAASGRLSQIAENDQRYYAVNSAARLLVDLIDGEEVTIVKTGSSYAFGDGSPTSFDSLVKEAAYYYVSTTNAFGRDVNHPYSIALTVSDGSTTIAPLAVTVKESLVIDNTAADDGTMVLKIESGAGTKAYAMELTFRMDAKKLEEQRGTQTVTTWTISWHIQDVQIAGAKRWVE